jgi:DNA mismatch endonuclease (patch repair protein)
VDAERSLAVVADATRTTMQANRGRDTGPELRVRRLLHGAGLRYRVATPLPFDHRRRADIYFSRVGLFVFIDGCYWHGCPEHFQVPKTNTEFWVTKIQANRLRDRDTDERLWACGLVPLRFWEHEDPESAAEAITSRYRALLASPFHGGGVPEA